MSRLAEKRRAIIVAGRRQKRLYWLAFVVVLVLLPFIFSSGFQITILTKIAIAAIFALSYNMLLGQGGMLSFGHAVYFGLGGYLSVHLMNYVGAWHLPIPMPLLPLFGGLFGFVFGLLFGSFSTRRAGTVFAMISLGIAELVAASSLILVGFFGGEEGITGNRTKGPVFFGYNLAQDIQVYYLAAAWFLLATFLMYRFSRTPAGRMANAVRDNPERAEFVGYSQHYVRLISFCASGFFAGLAGGLAAIQFEIVTEASLNPIASGVVLLEAYIGGIGYFIGPIVGAILLTLLSTVLSTYSEIWQLYTGLLFVATVLFVPQGLTGLLMMHGPAFRAGRLGRLVVPYLIMAVPVLCMLVGAIGLLELTYFRNNTSVDDRVVELFYVPMNVDYWLPWAVLAALTVVGLLGFRALRPRLAAGWAEANAPVRAEPDAAELKAQLGDEPVGGKEAAA